MAKWLRKLEQSAGLVGKVFNNLTTNSDIDAPSVNAVRGALYKPNLLINGDFQCNQRGQESYEVTNNNIFTFDMWRIIASNTTTKVSRLDNGVKFENLATGDSVSWSKNKN